MARFTHSQNGFTAGRFSGRLHGRFETPQYAQGAAELLNFIVQPQGGAARRPGTEFITEAKIKNLYTTGKRCRLIPFVFSVDEAYCIVLYERVAGHENTNNHIEIINISDKRQCLVNFLATSAYVLKSFNDGSTAGGGFKPTADELDFVQFAQNGDVLIMVHPKYNPTGIVRLGENRFIVSHFQGGFDASFNPAYSGGIYQGVFESDATIGKRTPFLDVNKNQLAANGHFLKLSSTSPGTRTLYSLNGSGLGETDPAGVLPYFQAKHIGAMFRGDANTTTGFCVVTGITNPYTATVEVFQAFGGDFAALGGAPIWYESLWSDLRGWPRSVCFFQSRILYGGSDDAPTVLAASELNDFSQLIDVAVTGETYTIGIQPFKEFIQTPRQDPIQWLSPAATLTIGTGSCELIVTGPDVTAVFAADNKQFDIQTAHGSEHIQPLRISNSVFFVSRGGDKCREFTFNFDEDRFRAQFINLFSEDIARLSQGDHVNFVVPKILSLQYQDSKNQVIWAHDTNGGLFGCTRDKDTGVLAWHRHKVGGELSGEAAKIRSIAVLPSPNGDHEDLWVSVERTVNGATEVSIERVLQDFELTSIDNTSDDIRNKPVYSDAASYQKFTSSQTQFGGLTHLIGQTVVGIADNKYIGTKTVVEGSEYCTNPDAESSLTGWYHFTDVKTETGASGNVSVANDTITIASHGFREDQRIAYVASAGAIGGLVSGTRYYIKSPTANTFQLSFEKDFSAINLTSDAAGTHTFIPISEPSTGVGAAGPLTFQRSNVSPIAGAYSFELVRDAVNRNGVGVSFDFSIQNRDKGKRIELSLIWKVTGTLSANYYAVGIYDKTNAQLLRVETNFDEDVTGNGQYDRTTSTSKLFTGNSGAITDSSGTFRSNFIASDDSTEYRLIILDVNSGTQSGSLFFDSVSIKGSGYVTLDNAASEAIVGLNYNSDLQGLPIEAGSRLGVAQGSMKRINEARVRLHKTIGGKIGRDENTLVPMVFRHQNDIASNPLELFSGDKIYEFRGDTEPNASWFIRQDIPLPMTVLSVVSRGDTHD